jgi:flagellar protein FliS
MVSHSTTARMERAPIGLAWTLEDKGRLLLLLYDRALRCMEEAIELIETGDMEEKGKRLILAQDIVMQLTDALDGEGAGPEGRAIAANLERLYLYIYRRLIRGNNWLDIEAIAEARKLMGSLYEAWKQALAAGGEVLRPGRARL